MLNFDFQSIVAGLQAGSYQSQEVVKQDIQEVCRTSAESFSGQEQVSADSFTCPIWWHNAACKTCMACWAQHLPGHIINQTSLDSATHATVSMGCWACRMLPSDCEVVLRTFTTCCSNRLSDLMELSHSTLIQEAGLRRGKVLAAADQFAQLVGGVVETLVGQSVSAKGLLKHSSETMSEPVVRRIPLPPSIIANAEPFRHGDWRKEPYPTRQDQLTCQLTCPLLAYDWSCVFSTSHHCNYLQLKSHSSTAIVCSACKRGSKCQCRSQQRLTHLYVLGKLIQHANYMSNNILLRYLWLAHLVISFAKIHVMS